MEKWSDGKLKIEWKTFFKKKFKKLFFLELRHT